MREPARLDIGERRLLQRLEEAAMGAEHQLGDRIARLVGGEEIDRAVLRLEDPDDLGDLQVIGRAHQAKPAIAAALGLQQPRPRQPVRRLLHVEERDAGRLRELGGLHRVRPAGGHFGHQPDRVERALISTT
ncbi:MAG: hypothetical protein QM722_00245 [Piscinibacter sp.]